MKALVTGGAGFIGSHLVELLLARGAEVRVLDDFSTGRPANLRAVERDCEILTGDVRDEALLRSTLGGCELVFHLAAVPSVQRSVEEPRVVHDVNVNGTLGVLLAAVEAGVRRVVLASSCAVYGDPTELPCHERLPTTPLSSYAAGKVAGEAYCRAFAAVHGLETVALRYFNVYGPRQDPSSSYAAAIPRFVEAAAEGRPPTVYGDGTQTRDFVFVGDVAEGNLAAATASVGDGAPFNVGSGIETSVIDVLDRLSELAGRPPAPIHAEPRPGEILRSVADVSRAREHLGFTAAVSFEEGLARTLSASEPAPPAQPDAASFTSPTHER